MPPPGVLTASWAAAGRVLSLLQLSCVPFFSDHLRLFGGSAWALPKPTYGAVFPVVRVWRSGDR